MKVQRSRWHVHDFSELFLTGLRWAQVWRHCKNVSDLWTNLIQMPTQTTLGERALPVCLHKDTLHGLPYQIHPCARPQLAVCCFEPGLRDLLPHATFQFYKDVHIQHLQEPGEPCRNDDQQDTQAFDVLQHFPVHVYATIVKYQQDPRVRSLGIDDFPKFHQELPHGRVAVPTIGAMHCDKGVAHVRIGFFHVRRRLFPAPVLWQHELSQVRLHIWVAADDAEQCRFHVRVVRVGFPVVSLCAPRVLDVVHDPVSVLHGIRMGDACLVHVHHHVFFVGQNYLSQPSIPSMEDGHLSLERYSGLHMHMSECAEQTL